MSAETLAANIIVPAGGDIAVITTSTTDIITTLSATLQLGTLATGNYLTICADGGDVYCFFKSTGDDASAGGTISSAASATGSTQRAWLLKDGMPQHFRITRNPSTQAYRTRMYHVCTAAAKKIRIYPSSSPSTEGLKR